MAALVIEGLRKAFGETEILVGVDLHVATGSLVAILGASGGGKTTLLRLIAGFERADAGTIRYGDRLIVGPGLHIRPERRGIGYVPQEGALFPHLSVAENIAFGLPRSERRSSHRIGALLSMLSLPASFAGRHPHQLSGGEQQRVALARALAPNPALVLLDEPFSALDTGLRVETRAAVANALATAAAAAILVTHDQPEALSMGNPVAVLRQGRLIQVSSPRDLYSNPISVDLARFVGEAVFLEGISKDGRVDCCLGSLALAPGTPEGRVNVLIRPEQIHIAKTNAHGGTLARVKTVNFYGPDARVQLCLLGCKGVEVSARVAGFQAPDPRDRVWASVEGEVVAFDRSSNTEMP